MAYNYYVPSYNQFGYPQGQFPQTIGQNAQITVPNQQMNGFQNSNGQQMQGMQAQQMNTYQNGNMGVPQMQNVSPAQPQQQIMDGGFVYVQGEPEAVKYPVAHGYSVTFKDETAPYLYKKTVGFSLLDVPVFEKYRLVKEETEQESKQSAQPVSAPAPVSETPPQQAETPDYIKREELNAFIDRLDTLSDALDVLKNNYTKMQSDIAGLTIAKPVIPNNKDREKKGTENK